MSNKPVSIRHFPVPIHYNIPNWYKKMKITKNTGLYFYLQRKNAIHEGYCKLTNIIEQIYQDIITHKLTDITNPEMIICNNELEEVLRVKSCHYAQIIDLLNYSLQGEEKTNYYGLTQYYLSTAWQDLNLCSKTERLNKLLREYFLKDVYVDPRCNKFIYPKIKNPPH